MDERLPFEKVERQIITKRESETDKRYGKSLYRLMETIQRKKQKVLFSI